VLLESALGVLALLAWRRLTSIRVLVTSIGTVAVGAVSRMVGMPFGPADLQVPEAVGTADLVCGGLEPVAAAVCAFSLTPPPVAAGSGRPSLPGGLRRDQDVVELALVLVLLGRRRRQ
jgi:hypothetical protein